MNKICSSLQLRWERWLLHNCCFCLRFWAHECPARLLRSPVAYLFRPGRQPLGAGGWYNLSSESNSLEPAFRLRQAAKSRTCIVCIAFLAAGTISHRHIRFHLRSGGKLLQFAGTQQGKLTNFSVPVLLSLALSFLSFCKPICLVRLVDCRGDERGGSVTRSCKVVFRLCERKLVNTQLIELHSCRVGGGERCTCGVVCSFV